MKTITFDQYVEYFKIFGEYTEEYELQLEHLLETCEGILEDGFSILDIGAGTGFFLRDFIEYLELKPAHYTGIEPSPVHYKNLKENFRELSMDQNLIEDIFTPQTHLKREYDLIILSHSLYWFIPDPEPYLLNMVNHLKNGGVAVMYLQTPFTASNILNLLFNDILPAPQVPNHRLTSWKIMDILEKNGIRYQVKNLPGTLKADFLFKEEEVMVSHALISLFLSTDAQSMDEETLHRAEYALRKLTFLQGSKRKLNLEVGAITVFNR